jgi:hypothetical protein
MTKLIKDKQTELETLLELAKQFIKTLSGEQDKA